MSLVTDVAWTHVRSRARQTVVAVAGVATGVGFSIMMAALMVGSQSDFIRQLVDTLPHVSITDERRKPPPQPSEAVYDAAEIRGLTPEARRKGIKNPLATLVALRTWLPGDVTPSVQTKGILRYANRDVAISIVGIDPAREAKVSTLATHMRQGTLNSLYGASNAIILGDRLAEKISARIGSNLTIQSSGEARLNAQVVGIFHSGTRFVDESTAYVLIKTGQILEQQTGIVNELRVRVADPMEARQIAERIEGETGYKSVSWQEANEDILSTLVIRNIIMYTIVGAILMVASFGTYNIISTITHEKARDIAIMKSLGLDRATVQWIFIAEAMIIGLAGSLAGFALGYTMTAVLGSIEIKSPFMDMNHLPVVYSPWHYLIAASVAVVSSLIAGYLPARRAAGVHPVDIIRGAT